MRIIPSTSLALAAAVAAGLAGSAAYAAGAYTVATGMASIQGVPARVLTTAGGLTLYYSTADTPTSSACTGGWCAQLWSPLLSATAPTGGDALPGGLSLVRVPAGPQVAYNGHLLYTYAGDTVPGQTNGQGVAGRWWVATVDLKPAAAPTGRGGTGGGTGSNGEGAGGGGTGGGGGGGMGGGHY